ncbi:MAG: hypothetical protein ACOC35_03155 [Promethearchaeia archaeon]
MEGIKTPEENRKYMIWRSKNSWNSQVYNKVELEMSKLAKQQAEALNELEDHLEKKYLKLTWVIWCNQIH